MLGDTPQPIISAGFVHEFNPHADVRGYRLIDDTTKICGPCSIANLPFAHLLCLVVPSTSRFHNLLTPIPQLPGYSQCTTYINPPLI